MLHPFVSMFRYVVRKIRRKFDFIQERFCGYQLSTLVCATGSVVALLMTCLKRKSTMAVGFRAEAFRIILLCSLWYTISSTNNVIGKKLLMDFPYPVTVAMVHLLSTATYLSPTLHIWKVPRMPSIPKSSLITLILPLSFGKAFSSITSHISIWKVPVSYAHTGKTVK